ncbi:hypothetical protein [Stenotrophomonas sp. Iso1]|uniref:hypothetical protein n=1 Tax=Stenotrophomonas sp. Iso1 TaxID=2977283 RepID=UPI0022B7CD0A|nr:hypothetical protein [Stenotrophomonas sp. Iso1]
MSSDASWKTAQQVSFVAGPTGYVPTHPAVKAAEAEAIRNDVEAFKAAGGQVIAIPSPSAR